MTITYCRNDPISSRWSGVGRLLTEYEVDYNFYQHDTRIATLETNYTLTVSVASISQPSVNTLLFTMTDASTQGPFTMPVATFQDRGTWAASTVYVVNDTFTANGALYRVIFDHTSQLTFSPTANDGAGHDYYAAMMSSPGNALPTGGAAAQVLQKSSSTDYAVTWGYKLPTGGTANQVLLKQSSTNQDAAWTTLGATMVSFHGSTASGLTSTNVAAALEEIDAALRGFSSSLAGLSDVQFSTGSPVTGSILYFGGTKWAASAAPSTNDLLQFDGSVWAPLAVSSLSITFSQITGSLSVSQLRNTTETTLGTTGAVSLDPSLGNLFNITPTGDCTITATSIPVGAEITLIIHTSGATSRTITFSGGTFKAQGTLATGTASGAWFVVKFIGTSNPQSWFFETSRTVAMT